MAGLLTFEVSEWGKDVEAGKLREEIEAQLRTRGWIHEKATAQAMHTTFTKDNENVTASAGQSFYDAVKAARAKTKVTVFEVSVVFLASGERVGRLPKL